MNAPVASTESVWEKAQRAFCCFWIDKETGATIFTKPEDLVTEKSAVHAQSEENMPAPVVDEGQTSAPVGAVPPVYYDPANTERRKKLKLEMIPSELLTPDFAVFRLEKILAKQQVYGFPGTKGDKMECFKQHLMNEHSIFGIFKAHSANPFTQKERLVYLVTLWMWSFFISTVLTYVNWTYIKLPGDVEVCVPKPIPTISSGAVVIFTMMLILPMGYILRFLLSCSSFYDVEYSGNVKSKIGCLFKGIEFCGKAQVFVVFGQGLILMIIGIFLVNTCNSRGGEMQSGTVFVIAQLSTAFGSEIVQMAAKFYWTFDTHKEEFECTHACQFPEGSPPTDMTQVALRAKENFMWDPLVYGRSADGAQDKKLNRANALTSFNAKFGAFYESSFGIGNEEGVTATPPPGLVDGVTKVQTVDGVKVQVQTV